MGLLDTLAGRPVLNFFKPWPVCIFNFSLCIVASSKSDEGLVFGTTGMSSHRMKGSHFLPRKHREQCTDSIWQKANYKKQVIQTKFVCVRDTTSEFLMILVFNIWQKKFTSFYHIKHKRGLVFLPSSTPTSTTASSIASSLTWAWPSSTLACFHFLHHTLIPIFTYNNYARWFLNGGSFQDVT